MILYNDEIANFNIHLIEAILKEILIDYLTKL